MARKLEDQANVDAPSVDYPYGRIRDDDGSANGTPLNEAVHGDYHQFFARILAESDVTANSLPDNATNGFEYYQALIQVISKRLGRYSVNDTVQGSASTNFNDYILPGIFPVTSSFSNGPSGLGNSSQLIVSRDDSGDVFQKVFDLVSGAVWARVYIPSSWGAWVLIKYAEKEVNIVDWNMDSTSGKIVAHTIADHTKIKRITAWIRDDTGTNYSPLNRIDDPTTGLVSGGITIWNSSNVFLSRYTGGGFDNTDYDSVAGYVRGYIRIEYEP